jgi:hypothetical protein
MAGPTTYSVGSVTISADGGITGDQLAAVKAATAGFTVGDQIVTVGAGAVSLPAPLGPDQELVIQPGYTGSLVIPPGWKYVIDGSTLSPPGALSGGDPATTIVGDLNYTGPAGSIIVTEGTGTVVATDPTGAMLSFFTGTYDIKAFGSSDTINLDNGLISTVRADGENVTFNLGSPTTTSSGARAAGLPETPASNIISLVPTAPGGTDVVNVNPGSADELLSRTALVVNATGGAVTVVAGGAGNTMTVNASGGFQLLQDAVGGAVVNMGPNTDYQNNPGEATTSTLTGSFGGDDTVWALTAVDYNGGLSNSTFFVGSPTTGAAETVQAGANATVDGGENGGLYTEGTTTFDFFGNVITTIPAATASDTIMGSASSAFVWGNNNENITVSQSTPATNFDQGGIYVAFGSSDTINTASSSGGNSFILYNAAGATTDTGFYGNTTIVVSNTGFDDVSFFASATTPAHTVTIDNWQSTDIFFMGNYSTADQNTATQALNAAAGGPTEFTLSDGTTINFVGTSPLDNGLFEHT